MFCINCGSKMDANQQFCTSCGTKVSNTYDQTTNLQAKKPVWVLQTNKSLSMLKIITCYVIFYEDRLLLAHLSTELQKSESAKKSAEIKANGLNFFKGSAEMMRFWSSYHEKYNTMTQLAILAEDPLNVEIPYNMISELYFSAYNEGDDDERSTGGKINISLNNGQVIKLKHKLSHGASVKSTLDSLLGSRVHYKK